MFRNAFRMFSKIIGFSLQNKVLILLGTVGLMAWGVYSFSRLPIDAIPDITNNQVQILTVCPTLSTQEVERFVTMPIEQGVRNSPGIIELRSISRFGLSVVTVVFDEGMSIYQARQIIQERLQHVADEIPEAFGSPEMAPISTGLGEILHYSIEALPGFEDRYSASDLRTIQDWIVKRQLAGIEGVVEINSMGGHLKQYEIAVEPARLRAYDISLTTLYEAVSAANQNTGAAYMEKHTDLYFIRAEGLLRTTEEIGQIVIAQRGPIPVLVRDVATVREGHAIRYGAVTSSGKGEIVLGIVMMLKDANAAHVIRRVKERMQVIEGSLPEGVVLRPFLDRELLVGKTIHTVRNNLLYGAGIVMLMLFLLVGDWRASLIISAVIPMSMLLAVILMVETGVTANLMSLGALDFGLVIDGAIILVEATLFYLLLRRKTDDYDRTLTQAEMDDAIRHAADKVARASVYGVLIIIIVYLPIMSLTGIEGKMFRPMAMTVSFALLGALFLSLTFIPVAAALFLSKKQQPESRVSAFLMGGILTAYQPMLRFALRWPAITVGMAVGALVVVAFIFSRMGGEFIPELDEGDIMLHGFCKPGTSLTQTMESHRILQEVLMAQFPDEVDQIISKIGTAEIPTDPMAIESADNIVLLHPVRQWTRAATKEALIEKMETAVEDVPGMAFEFTQPIKMRFDEMMTGVRSDVALKLFGENLDTLAHYARQIAILLGQVEGLRDLKIEQVLGLPQLQVTYRYDQMARHGIRVQDANEAVRLAFAGGVAGHMYEEEKRFDLVIRLPETSRQDIRNLHELPVRTASGTLIPLSAVADIRFSEGAAQISRDNGQRRIVVSANVRGRDVESSIGEIERRVQEGIKLPAGYYIAYGGQFENLREAKERLQIAVPLALFLIAVLLFITFGRITETALIFTAIPMAAIGGVLALWIRGMPFSISAGVGFIALFGIAVLNSIVLMTYLNELEQEGVGDLRERLRQATRLRLRPVMMTAATDALGFLPMALATSAGAEVQRPLATVVVGGLITATMLTLVVLPALYLLVKGWQSRRMARYAGVGLLLLVSGMLPAQTPALPVEEALSLVRERHPAVRVGLAAMQEEQARRHNPVLWEPARFYHGINADPGEGFFGTTFVGGEVFIPARSRVRATRRWYDSRAESARLGMERTLAQTERDVRRLYLELSHNREEHRIFRSLDSLHRELVRIAQVRHASGETGRLEAVLAADKSRQMSLEVHQTDHEFHHLSQELSLLIRSDYPILPLVEDLMHEEVFGFEPAGRPQAGLMARHMQSRIMEATWQRDMHRAMLKPEWGADLMAQLLPTGEIYPGYNLSLRIPIFRKGYDAQIAASQVGILRAEAERDEQMLYLDQQLIALEHQIEVLRHRLHYFHQEGLPAAEELLRVARAGYSNGDAPFADLLLAIDQASQTRLDYLRTLLDTRRHMLEYQYLTR
jgi:cobalt-zinc-cadmium resistance protein CzcA